MENIDWALPITLTIKVTGLSKTLESNTQEGESAVGQMMSNPRNPLLTEDQASATTDAPVKDIDCFFGHYDDPLDSVIQKHMDKWREQLIDGHEEHARKHPHVDFTDEGINITHYVDAGEDLREAMAYWMADELGAEFAKKLETKREEKTIEEKRTGDFFKESIDDDNPTMPNLRFIEKDDD